MYNTEPISMQSYLPIYWKKANNDIIIDINNKKYIDFTSSIFVMNVGHSNKRVKKYLKKQINKNLLHSYIYTNEIRMKFIEKLIENTPDFCEKVFLTSSGTEATEVAVKLMREYTDGKTIVSFKGSMHGKTMAAELMKGSNYYKHPDFKQLDFPNDSFDFMNDFYNLKINIKDVCGFMIETYQGWSAEFLPKQYVKDICHFAKKNDKLVCFDEIQSGIGRTGILFGYGHYGVTPDLICIGKAIGGGLPLSGILGKRVIFKDNIELSSTHSANPLCCVAGLAVLEEVIDKKLVLQSYKKGKILKDELNKFNFKMIKKINSKGLIASIIVENKNIADQVCLLALNKGLLLVHTGRNSIKIGPPLTIKVKNLLKGIKILEEIFNDIED